MEIFYKKNVSPTILKLVFISPQAYSTISILYYITRSSETFVSQLRLILLPNCSAFVMNTMVTQFFHSHITVPLGLKLPVPLFYKSVGYEIYPFGVAIYSLQFPSISMLTESPRWASPRYW